MPEIRFPVKAARPEVAVAGRGMIAESFPLAAAATALTPTSQTVYAWSIGLRAGDVVTNIVMSVGTAASGTSPTGMFVGLYDKNGVSLAVSANQNAAATYSGGPKAIPLSAPYTVPTDDLYYAVFLQNGAFGTTNPTFFTHGSATNNSVALSGGVRAYCTFGTLQTALTTVGQTAPTAGAIGNAPWFGVS